MTSEPTGTRLVDFEACFNFRDFGGYPTRDGRRVRSGLLWRSDTLHRLTDNDLAGFRALGLRTVVDLRARTELDDYGALRPDARDGLVWEHLPMVDEMVLRPRAPDSPEPPLLPPGESYLRMLGDGTTVAGAMAVLTDPDRLPAVVHCTAGKDRTGMVVAMALDLLGVDDDVILADYEATNAVRARSMAWIERHEPHYAEYLRQIPEERRMARPEVMEAFLAGLRSRHGSVEGLLRSHGIGPARVERFRAALLEE